MSKLKLQKDSTAQVVISIDNSRIVLEECKIFANAEGEEEIVFQAVDKSNDRRMIQITITKSTEEIEQ